MSVVVCSRRLSGSVTLHGGPTGGFTRAGQAMTSCRLHYNYSSTAARRASHVTSRYGDTLRLLLKQKRLLKRLHFRLVNWKVSAYFFCNHLQFNFHYKTASAHHYGVITMASCLSRLRLLQQASFVGRHNITTHATEAIRPSRRHRTD